VQLQKLSLVEYCWKSLHVPVFYIQLLFIVCCEDFQIVTIANKKTDPRKEIDKRRFWKLNNNVSM
jgi:hypothetical protein